MKKLFSIFITIFITSCSSVDFVYKDSKNVMNPLYEKTKVGTSGIDINFINPYIPVFFGINKQDLFNLSIKIKVNKTKRSIETNQTASNVRYEIRLFYTLKLNEKDCVTYKKEVSSYFSIIPKSSGYNYGTDASLEKKYELAITENLNRFISILSEADIESCL
tara:strand:+ start:418 stop:906 length:489 start_codon:yes stop_codon:yes gene_type:complete